MQSQYSLNENNSIINNKAENLNGSNSNIGAKKEKIKLTELKKANREKNISKTTNGIYKMNGSINGVKKNDLRTKKMGILVNDVMKNAFGTKENNNYLDNTTDIHKDQRRDNDYSHVELTHQPSMFKEMKYEKGIHKEHYITNVDLSECLDSMQADYHSTVGIYPKFENVDIQQYTKQFSRLKTYNGNCVNDTTNTHEDIINNSSNIYTNYNEDLHYQTTRDYYTPPFSNQYSQLQHIHTGSNSYDCSINAENVYKKSPEFFYLNHH